MLNSNKNSPGHREWRPKKPRKSLEQRLDDALRIANEITGTRKDMDDFVRLANAALSMEPLLEKIERKRRRDRAKILAAFAELAPK